MIMVRHKAVAEAEKMGNEEEVSGLQEQEGKLEIRDAGK